MSSHFYNDQIPQGWEAAIIGVCIETITPPSKLNTIEYGESGKFPIIDQSQDFICGWTDDEKKVLKISEPLIVFGDHTCVTKFVNFDFAQGADGIKILKSKKSLNPEFLYQLLQFDPIAPEMYKRHFSKLKGKKILYPKDKAEQEMIAQVLGDMDDLISAKCELLDKKRAIKQASAQQLLTPKPHWHTATLGNVGEIITGSTPSTTNEKFWNGDIAWITPTDIGDKKDIFTGERSITQDGLKATRELPENSLLVTCIASIGKNAVLKVKGSCNQQINALIPNKNFNVDFLYYLLEFEKERLKNLAGITATLIISKALFSKFEISYPNFTEQTKIALFLSDMDNEISALQDEIEKLKMIKQGAMDELLSGKIRLKG